MQSTGNSFENELTAAEYGCREKCFIRHTKSPYCYAACQRQIQSFDTEAISSSLASQPGLHTFQLPQPTLEFDDAPSDITEDYLHIPHPSEILNLKRAKLEELLRPLEPPDLGPLAATDVAKVKQAIVNVRACDLSRQWLPLATLKRDNDESLEFPPCVEKDPICLLKDLEHDSLEINVDKSLLADLLGNKPLELCNTQLLLEERYHQNFFCLMSGKITPPVSECSESLATFLPNDEAATIDLTSESPRPVKKYSKGLGEGILDSGPIVLSDKFSQTLGSSGQKVGRSLPASEEGKVDLPLVPFDLGPSSDKGYSSSSKDLFSMLYDERLDVTCSDATNLGECNRSVLDEQNEVLNDIVGREGLNSLHSSCRVLVPSLDFKATSPKWAHVAKNGRQQFNALQAQMPTLYKLPLESCSSRLIGSLRWTPIPGDLGYISIDESISGQDEPLIMDNDSPCKHPTKLDVTLSDFKILKANKDVELDQVSGVDDPKITGGSKSRVLSPVTCQDSGILDSDRTTKAALTSPIAHTRDSKGSHTSKRFVESNPSTSRLLDDFIEMRAAKRPRLAFSSTQERRVGGQGHPRARKYEGFGHRATHEHTKSATVAVPAPVPGFVVPVEQGVFAVSLTLPLPLLKLIKKSWPTTHFIDCDHTCLDFLRLGTPKQLTVESVIEADISLTPKVGLVVTTLLKARQKPLPGDRSQTILRERIQRVSCMYETLYVLVSEDNAEGESMAKTSESDTRALADFTAYTLSLDRGIITVFIPGSQETLSNWILFFMCHYSREASSFKDCMLNDATAFDRLFRRAGMNIFAARVLCDALFRDGDARPFREFLSQTNSERLAIYGKLIGERSLRNVCVVLDQLWSS